MSTEILYLNMNSKLKFNIIKTAMEKKKITQPFWYPGKELMRMLLSLWCRKNVFLWQNQIIWKFIMRKLFSCIKKTPQQTTVKYSLKIIYQIIIIIKKLFFVKYNSRSLMPCCFLSNQDLRRIYSINRMKNLCHKRKLKTYDSF